MYPAVYSYKKTWTRELELSIDSLKNIKEWNGQVFIIGDKPDFKGDYIHYPIKYDWGKGSKSNDEICAYLTASDFLDDFIIMADDIYVLKPWSLEYQNRVTLEEHSKSRVRGDIYGKTIQATKEFLEENNMPALSYDLHIPFLVNSEQIRDCAEIIRIKQPMLIRSIIGNWYEIPSKKATDPKNINLTEETVLYSSSDNTFSYERVRKYLK